MDFWGESKCRDKKQARVFGRSKKTFLYIPIKNPKSRFYTRLTKIKMFEKFWDNFLSMSWCLQKRACVETLRVLNLPCLKHFKL